ncbi:MAG: NGG1p interacting factor NIF3 [Candidatus Moranbacteria bacterium]|nr:NGG1p interacting factor NIF3 [Candidatus Moranbacteria bacterium]MDD5651983.1 NGG1p interacting factor NIF3 [Candidatus Moranbacteria bacterium]MDX9855920.1 NGG1p interacting factor NIF3 [Candidatus Moranbacteria bacterium]
MDLKQIYKMAIDLGIKNDLRPKKEIEKKLSRIKKQYQKLDEKEKKDFDKERLSNPFMDSTIHFDSGKKIKKVLVGIDIDAGELLIAKELGADAVIAHHPIGKGLSYLDDVMQLQADVLAQYGVPINVAEGLMRIRISEVSRSVNPVNHFKSPMAAKNLGMSFMNVHTPADNMVATFLKKLMDDKKPEYVSEVIEILEKIPEYKEAKKQGLGPRLFAGNKENRAGKIAITEITGGTEGSVKIYEKMANAGVGTILAMHQSEKHREAAEKANINVVIAGHISSDSIGVNLFLDELEKKGIKIIPCSGLIRYSRVKK